MALNPLDNLRTFPPRPQVAGADRVTTREQDPYGLEPNFERSVVYLLCTHRKFFEAMAPNIHHKLLGCREAQLLVDAAQNTAQRLKRPAQDYTLVLETLAGYVRDGKVSDSEALSCRQYLEDAEDAGIPPYADVHAMLVPTMQERITLALMRETRESFGHRKGVQGTERLIQQYHKISELEVTRGIQVDGTGAALIREMLTAERMTTGLESIDSKTRGGFYVGTTTNFLGGTGCLRGDTEVYDPLDKSNYTVEERTLRGVGFHVWAKGINDELVIGAALPPVKYPPTQMLEVVLEDGKKIVVTPQHRFWSDQGWLYASEVSVQLRESSVYLRATSLDTFPEVREIGGFRWTQTTQDSLSGCPRCRCLYDEQPLSDQGSVPFSAPSLSGAPVHTPQNLHGDAQGLKSQHNPACPTSDLPSKRHCQDPCENLHRLQHPQRPVLPLQPELEKNPTSQTQQPGRGTPGTIEGLPTSALGSRPDVVPGVDSFVLSSVSPDSNSDRWNCNSTYMLDTRVVSIRSLETEPYYDFHVPVFNNYWAQGFWNHNCGKSLVLTQIAVHLTLKRGENVTFASLELAESLQLARYMANALNLDFEAVMKQPEECVKRMRDMYPSCGQLRIGFFDAGNTNFGTIRNWRDQIQQETGLLFRGNVLDYLTLLRPSKGNPNAEGHQTLDASSMEVVGYTKENSIWTFTASAPTRENDEVQVKNSEGKFKLPKNNGVGGAYAISKNMDTNIWLVRVCESEETFHDYEVVPVCTKDRLGCSGESGWVGQPMKPAFQRSRIDFNTSHEREYKVRPEEDDKDF